MRPCLAGGFRDHRVSRRPCQRSADHGRQTAAAVRKKKDSSIVRAVELVHDGKADAVVSLGNTGGIFAAATFKLGRIPGVDRGGIATVIPTPSANLFCLMPARISNASRCTLRIMRSWAAFTRGKFLAAKTAGRHSQHRHRGKQRQRLTLEAFKLCKQLDINFIGNVEGHDLFKSRVDVVVCDGFVGNIVLKTCESLAMGIFSMLKA